MKDLHVSAWPFRSSSHSPVDTQRLGLFNCCTAGLEFPPRGVLPGFNLAYFSKDLKQKGFGTTSLVIHLGQSYSDMPHKVM